MWFLVSKFIITPNEFKDFLQLCNEYNIKYFVPTYGYPQNSIAEVLQEYTQLYETNFAEKKSEIRTSIYYSMQIKMPNYTSGFFLSTEEIYFPHHKQWAQDKIPYLRISFPKGYQVDYEDDKGKYFVYEDINLYEPEMYPIFEKLQNYIKQFTKPFRFESIKIDQMEENKTPVRISQQAAEDLSNSWFFKDYELKMRSWKK